MQNNSEVKVAKISRKKDAKYILPHLGFIEASKQDNWYLYIKELELRIHIIWKNYHYENGYYAHIEKYPH